MAAFSCDDESPLNSSAGTTYTQECGVYYQTNYDMIAPRRGHPVQNLPIGPDDKPMDAVLTSSFMDCIDRCDEYHSANQSVACYGVTYYANLAWVQSKAWDGNCFLKNGRGKGSSDGNADWEHTASAYKTCLNDGEDACLGDD
jgi:hypothetical protein